MRVIGAFHLLRLNVRIGDSDCFLTANKFKNRKTKARLHAIVQDAVFAALFNTRSVTVELASKVACKLVPISVRLRCGGLFETSRNLAAILDKLQQISCPSRAQTALRSPLVYTDLRFLSQAQARQKERQESYQKLLVLMALKTAIRC